MFEHIPYRKPLVIGTGGGNDIVSATLVLADLHHAGIKADLAGLCSPAAMHSYAGRQEQEVNIVCGETKRWLPAKKSIPLSFIDAAVPALLEAQGIDAVIYNLSCRYGTKRLAQGLDHLIKQNGYDGVIAVDVGGDILARGAQDPTILSPLMDFTTLYVVGQLDVPSTLVEFGLQTDGELRTQGCREILDELRANGALKETASLDSSSRAFSVFRNIYDGVKSIRHGHTAAMTLQTLESSEDIRTEYRSSKRIIDKTWEYSFPITLEQQYFGKAFVIDLKMLAASRSLAFAYDTSLEQMLRIKREVDCMTEMDCHCTWVDGTCVWLGVLPPQFEGMMRKEMLEYGLGQIPEHADAAIVWGKDSPFIPVELPRDAAHPFLAVGKDRDASIAVAQHLWKLGHELRVGS